MTFLGVTVDATIACSSGLFESDPDSIVEVVANGGSSAKEAAATEGTVAQVGGKGNSMTPAGGQSGLATAGTRTSTGVPGAGGARSGSTLIPSTDEPPLRGLSRVGKRIIPGAPCTAQDVQLCRRTCGVLQSGLRVLKCTDGIYREDPTQCLYPQDRNDSCYAKPETQSAAFQSGDVHAGAACAVAPCNLCSNHETCLGADGAPKARFCVRVDVSGNSRIWQCAPTINWPCPGNPGCF